LLIFSQASIVAELLAILWLYTEENVQTLPGAYAATWWQKLAHDSS